MSQKNYSGSIALTKLIHVMMTKKGKSGKEIKGLFIPIENNYLVAGKEDSEGNISYYMPVSIIAKDEPDKYGQNGFIAQKCDTKTYKEADIELKEKLKKLPILGSIKHWSNNEVDSTGNKGGGKTFDEKDNLPF